MTADPRTGDPITIQLAEPAHEAQILALGHRTLGWKDEQRTTDLYRWKHDENPFGPSPRWVALHDGRVVGFRVLLRWGFRRPDGSTAVAVRAVDTATDPDHQGKGIFRSLTTTAVDELRAQGVHLIFNTPNGQSRPGYLKMGWSELGRPRVAVRPKLLSVARVATSRVPADLWSQETTAGHDAPAYFDDPRHDAVIADLIGDGPTGRWCTDRSVPWLRWRYGLPHLRYRVISSDDLGGGSPGLVVFRVRRRGAALEATVCEVLTSSPRTRRRLLRAVLRSSGADYLLVASDRIADLTPTASLPALAPVVTWRALDGSADPAIGDIAFSIGDLELF